MAKRRRRGKRNARGQFVKRRRRAAAPAAAPRRRRRRARAAAPAAAPRRRSRRRRARAAAPAAAAPRRRRRRSRRRARAAAPAAAPRRRSRRRSRRRARAPRKVHIYRRRPVVRRRSRRIAGRRRRVYTVKGRSKRDRNRGILTNPVSGGELVTIGFTGLLGFAGADMLDRFLASHPLDATSAAALASTGKVIDKADGTRYPGMFNGAAIAAPMDVTRWAAGLGATAVPIIIGGFVRAPMWRAVFQGFGIGAGLRTLGKGFSDLMAMLFKPSATSPHATMQRLYVNEMVASSIKAQDAAERLLIVAPGLGYPGAKPGCSPGCRCAACGQAGVGAPPGMPTHQHSHGVSNRPQAPPPALPLGNPGQHTRNRFSVHSSPIRTGWRSNQRTD
jgi:hypothetical protein